MKAIAAMDLNRVIGSNGAIPWHLPEDLRWFKQFTLSKTIIVGRTTFTTLPPLKNRDIVVLTNSKNLEPMYAKSMNYRNFTIRNSATFDPTKYPDAIVAGGAITYKLLLPHCDELYMTYVLNEYEGDTVMPPFEDLFPNSEIKTEASNYWIVRYWK